MIKLSHCYYHNSTQEQLNLTAQSQDHNLVDKIVTNNKTKIICREDKMILAMRKRR